MRRSVTSDVGRRLLDARQGGRPVFGGDDLESLASQKGNECRPSTGVVIDDDDALAVRLALEGVAHGRPKS